jgi:hypothetical protein
VKLLFTICFLLLVAVTAAAAAEIRTWTFEKSGKTMQGEVAGFGENSVTLKLPEGKTASVPIAYLSERDRTYLTAEHASQWKEVELVKLEGAASSGRYKRCTVRGEVSGEILLQLLPASAEAILNNKDEQADQIEYLKSWIADRDKVRRQAKAFVHDSNRAAHRRYRYVIAKEWAPLYDAKADLPKLQRAYEDYVKKTKAQRTVKVRNTGLAYAGSPVWECADPRKPQQ